MRFIKNLLVIFGLLSVNIASAKTMDIYAQVSANIVYVASMGSTVKKGEPLVKLDNSELRHKIKKQNALANLKKVYFDDAKKYYTQDKRLFEQTLISQRELDLSQITYLTKKYEYEIEEEELNVLKARDRLYTILAPFDCKIGTIPNYTNSTNIYNQQLLMKIKNSTK